MFICVGKWARPLWILKFDISYKFLAKKVIFLLFSGYKEILPRLSPLEKSFSLSLEKSTIGSPEKAM